MKKELLKKVFGIVEGIVKGFFIFLLQFLEFILGYLFKFIVLIIVAAIIISLTPVCVCAFPFVPVLLVLYYKMEEKKKHKRYLREREKYFIKNGMISIEERMK